MVRTILRLLALAVVVAGAAVASINLSRDEHPGEGSAEVGFARDMRTHHEQGVEMAELLRDRTDNEDLRVVAAEIALTQQAQIGQMRGWLDIWGVPPTSTEPPMTWAHGDGNGSGDGDAGHEMPGLASDDEIAALERATGGRAEVQFLQLMIRHHEGAVSMAVQAEELTDEDEVREFAGTIRQSQQAEIGYLTALLTAREAEPLPSILPEDLGEISSEAAEADGSNDGWDLVVDWWPVAVAGVVLLVLLRDLVRRPAARTASIAPSPTPVATVGDGPDEHPDRSTERTTERTAERRLDPLEELERFPLDDSGFDEL
jgi:uncharacterized protein (DUF305 family)